MLAKNQLQHVPSKSFANQWQSTAASKTTAAAFRAADQLIAVNLDATR